MVNRESSANIGNGCTWLKSEHFVYLRIELGKLSFIWWLRLQGGQHYRSGEKAMHRGMISDHNVRLVLSSNEREHGGPAQPSH